MIRIVLLIVLLAALPFASAALPSAPFTQEALNAVAENWSATLPQYEAEAASVEPGTPTAFLVLAGYLHDAFEASGYSLDETIYTYLSTSRPSSIQMHQFAQNSGLGAVLLGLDREDNAAILIHAGVMAKRTYEYAQKLDKKVPIQEADYILEGSQERPMEAEGLERKEYRNTGRMVIGDLDWDGWVVFSPGELVSGTSRIGIAQLSKLPTDYKEFLLGIVGEKKYVKIEGVTLWSPGSDTFFDETQDIRILNLK